MKTTVSKAIDAADGEHPKNSRGLYDSAAKGIVSTRVILAWIVKACIPEAAQYSIDEIASKFIEPDVAVSKTPVYRDDAEAEDHGKVRMEQTEDASVDEGVVRYDILFKLHLPGQEDPLTIIINVELQNRAQLDYPLVSRGMSYAGRLIGQQGPDYKNLRKVYSIWIVSNPDEKEENSVVSYRFRKSINGEACEQIEKDADMMEVVFFNLGEPEDVTDPEHPTALWLLDVLFSASMKTSAKKQILETDFGISMTRKLEENMVTMQDTRFAFEVEAERQGERKGVRKGERNLLYRLVRKGRLTIDEAAEEAQMSPESFTEAMLEAEAGSTAG